MATLSKIFNFNTGADGWQGSSNSGGLSAGYYPGPPASLLVTYEPTDTSSGVKSASINMSWQGSWEQLGVPANSTVTHIQLTSAKRQVFALGAAGSVTQGPLEFYIGSGGALQGTLLTARTRTTTDPTWDVSGAGSAYNLVNQLQKSTAVVELRIKTDNSVSSGYNQSYYDDLAFNITYVPPVFTGSAKLSTQHPTLVAKGTVSSPTSTGVARVSTTHPTLVAKGNNTQPSYTENGKLNVGHPNLVAKGTFTLPKFTGSAALSTIAQVGKYDNTNLALHWKVTEASGTTIADSSGKGVTGTLQNGVFLYNDAPTQYHSVNPRCLDFSGIDRRVTFPANALTDTITTQATFSVWVKLREATPSNAANTGFVHLAADGISPWPDTHYPYTDGKVYCTIFRSDRVEAIVPSATVDRTKWHHFCVTTKPGANGYVIYQNGQPIYTGTGPATVGLPSVPTLGGRTGSSFFMYGWMDDARIYNRALTSDEVQKLAGGYELSAVNFANMHALYTGQANLNVNKSLDIVAINDRHSVDLFITGHINQSEFNVRGLSKPCRLWLKSSSLPKVADGTFVNNWQDSSAYGNHFTNSYNGYAPVYQTNSIGKWPTVKFSGGQYLSKNEFQLLSSEGVTVFVVGKNLCPGSPPVIWDDGIPNGSGDGMGSLFGPTGIPSGCPILDYGINTNWQVNSSSFRYTDNEISAQTVPFNLDSSGCNDHHTLAIKQDGTRTTIFDNQTLKVDSNFLRFDSAQTRPMYLGADWDSYRFLRGDIAEVLVYDGPLRQDEFHDVRNYLENKYCAEGDLTPEVSLFIRGGEIEPLENRLSLYLSTGTFVNRPKGLNLSIKGPPEPVVTKVKTGDFFQPAAPRLFIKGSAGQQQTKTATLTIKGGVAGNVLQPLNLFLKANEVSSPTDLGNNRKVNLFVSGDIAGLGREFTGYSIFNRTTRSPNLFIKGKLGTLHEGTTSLVVNGFAPAQNAGMNLYIEQRGGGTSLPLSIRGLPAGIDNLFKSVALSTNGYIRMNNTVPLVLFVGSLAEKSMPLSIRGPIPASRSMSLHTLGPIPIAKGVNLFLKAQTPPDIGDELSLIIRGGVGGTTPTWAGGMPLFMEPSPPFNSNLNLYIDGVQGVSRNLAALNLVLKSSPPESSLYAPLYLMNEQEALAEVLDLYIAGLGKNPGYVPTDGIINMTVEGFGSGTLSSPISQVLTAPLTINGALSFATDYYSVIPLHLEVLEGYPATANSTLFVSGTTPPTANANIALVIYKTGMVKIAPLYIHGF